MNKKELCSAQRRSSSRAMLSEPELARADPLLVFLQELSAEDANEWHDVLLERRVRSLDDLVVLARDKEAWNAFYATLTGSARAGAGV